MAIDKKKLDAGLKKAVDIGTDIINTGVPIAGKVVNTGIDVLSSIFGGGKGTGTGSANLADYNKPYTQSDAVTQLGNNLNNMSKPVQQQSQFQQTLQQTMDQILNKGEFKYDVNADALYNQYKDQYILGGQMAMQDSMGQAAALTGGYGNSNAQTVGQQQYQVYLQQLTDKIPELYQLARDSYDRDLSNLYNRYGLLSDAEAKEYSRYRDEVSDFYADRDYLTNRYYNERDFDYGQWADNRDFAYAQHRDAVADQQWQKTFDRGVYESDRDYNRGVYESDRNYNYQVGRDAEADRQWQAAFDRGVYESDRDYNRGVFESDRNYDYTLSRDSIEDKRYDAQWQNTLAQQAVANSQWQKEYDLAVRKANADAYAKKQEALALYDNSKDTKNDIDLKTSAAKSIYHNFTKRAKSASSEWSLGAPLSDAEAIAAFQALTSAANKGSITDDEYDYLINIFGL